MQKMFDSRKITERLN